MNKIVLAVMIGMLAASEVSAQATGLPSYNAPYRAFGESERGVGVSFPGGTDAAFEGFYGVGRGVWDVRFRGGVALNQGPGGDAAGLIGAEFRTRVLTHSETFPADGALILGAGAVFGNSTNLLFPVGISLGRRIDIEDSDVSIVPYVQPTLLLVVAGDAPESTRFTLGIGGDFRLTPVFDLRVALGFGDQDGFSVGAVWLR